MGIIILTVLINITIAVVACVKMPRDERKDIPVLVIINLLVTSLIMVLVFFACSEVAKKTPVSYQYEKIATLSVHDNLSGGFVLGFGNIKENTYYYFYREVSGGYKLDRIGTNEVIIVEDDSLPPALSSTEYRFDSPFTRFMLGETHTSGVNRIIIPKGSIIKHYNPNY
jgi:hypothetical protein